MSEIFTNNNNEFEEIVNGDLDLIDLDLSVFLSTDFNNSISELSYESISENEDSHDLKRKREYSPLSFYSENEPKLIKDINIDSIYTIPTLIVQACGGNPDSGFGRLLSFMDPNCHISFIHPSWRTEHVGNESIIKLKNALINSQPDLITSSTKTEFLHIGNTVKIISCCRSKGTLLHAEYYNRFFGLKEDTLVSDYMFDVSKTSSKAIEKFRQIERNAVNNGQKVEIFVKLCIIFEFDLVTKLVRRQWARPRLSSLRLAHITSD